MCSEELHDFCFFSVIRLIESMKMRRVGHVERTGEKVNAWKFSMGRRKKETT